MGVCTTNWMLHASCFGIPATCYRTENAQIPKSAGESAGKSAGDCWGDCWGDCFFPKKPASQHCSQQSPQQSSFSRHSSQHSSRHFWGFGRSQSCSRSLGFQFLLSFFAYSCFGDFLLIIEVFCSELESASESLDGL